MSDLFYQFVRMIGRPPLWLSSRPVTLHADRVPRSGPLILAPNHSSAYDVPCLMRSTPRVLDFLSITEMENKLLIGRFYRQMNCIFVNRRRPDLRAARLLRDRLDQQRAVVMFPEGNIRTANDSVSRGGPFRTGVITLARQSGAPIQPCVLIGTIGYAQPSNWLPFRRWSYGIIFGQPIHVQRGDEAAATETLRQAYIDLQNELAAALTSDTSAREKTPAH